MAAAAGAAAFVVAKNRDQTRARRLANARVTQSGHLVSASGDVLNDSTDLVRVSQWGIGLSQTSLAGAENSPISLMTADSTASERLKNVPERKPHPRRHPPAMMNASPVLNRQETVIPKLGNNGDGTFVPENPLVVTPQATYLTTQTPKEMHWISIDDAVERLPE